MGRPAGLAESAAQQYGASLRTSFCPGCLRAKVLLGEKVTGRLWAGLLCAHQGQACFGVAARKLGGGCRDTRESAVTRPVQMQQGPRSWEEEVTAFPARGLLGGKLV